MNAHDSQAGSTAWTPITMLPRAWTQWTAELYTVRPHLSAHIHSADWMKLQLKWGNWMNEGAVVQCGVGLFHIFSKSYGRSWARELDIWGTDMWGLIRTILDTWHCSQCFVLIYAKWPYQYKLGNYTIGIVDKFKTVTILIYTCHYHSFMFW
jgi:hypothetical protein